MTEENGKDWLGMVLLALLAYSVGLAFISSSIIVFFEPRASASGVPETSAFLNGIQAHKNLCSLKIFHIETNHYFCNQIKQQVSALVISLIFVFCSQNSLLAH